MLPRPFTDPKDRIVVRSRIPELDGIRGIAVLLVIIHHSVANYTPLATWEKVVCQAVGIGWSGVDLFFVLSGFLISGILIDSRESPRYFTSFYARRVLRIFPLYFGYLLGFFCLIKPFAAIFPFPEVAKWSLLPATEQLWYWSYLSNWRSGLGHDISFLTHFWSLAIEEQFYMVWPLVVFFASRKALLRICIGIVVLAVTMRTGLELVRVQIQ
jgi:peptidoglycan/LPS O-acetylase OafA/YrhL